MDFLIDRWYNGRLPFREKEGIAREIIRYRYPDFSFTGKPMKQILAIAGSIVRKYEYENFVKKEVLEPSDTAISV
jgi:hypothetical protein